jgi:hypothetical protein
MSARFALVVCVLCGMQPALAEVYRWVDADGVTQFGERPPPEAGAERVKVRASGADPDAGARLDALQTSLEESREARAQRRAEAAAAASEAAAARERCAAARDHRTRLVTATRLFRVAADGSRERVGEAERKADLKRIDAAIDEHCR